MLIINVYVLDRYPYQISMITEVSPRLLAILYNSVNCINVRISIHRGKSIMTPFLRNGDSIARVLYLTAPLYNRTGGINADISSAYCLISANNNIRNIHNNRQLCDSKVATPSDCITSICSKTGSSYDRALSLQKHC